MIFRWLSTKFVGNFFVIFLIKWLIFSNLEAKNYHIFSSMKINYECKNNQLFDTLSKFFEKNVNLAHSSSYRCLWWLYAKQKRCVSVNYRPVSTLPPKRSRVCGEYSGFLRNIPSARTLSPDSFSKCFRRRRNTGWTLTEQTGNSAIPTSTSSCSPLSTMELPILCCWACCPRRAIWTHRSGLTSCRVL